jgi:hypothetical protein
MLHGPFKKNSSLLDILGPFFNRILFKLEVLSNWKMARYTGYKIKIRRVGQGHTDRVDCEGGHNPDRPKCLPHDHGHRWWWQKEMSFGDTFSPKECGSQWGNQVSGQGKPRHMRPSLK